MILVRTPSARRRQGGYTLIEVIVAFALLALGLSLLLGTLSGAARQVRWSGDAGRAALYAQSLLDQVGVGEELQPGQSEGDVDGGRYHWSLPISPWVDATVACVHAATQPARAAHARTGHDDAVGRGGRQRLQLRTLRAAPADTGGTLP